MPSIMRSGTQDPFSPSLLLQAEDQDRPVLYISFQNELPYLGGKRRATFTAQELQTGIYIKWYFQEWGVGGKVSSRLWAADKHLFCQMRNWFFPFISINIMVIVTEVWCHGIRHLLIMSNYASLKWSFLVCLELFFCWVFFLFFWLG